MAQPRYEWRSDPVRGSRGSHAVLEDGWTGEKTHVKFAPAGTEAAAALVEEGRTLAGLGHPLITRYAGGLGPETRFRGGRVTGFKTVWTEGVGLSEWARNSSLLGRMEAIGQLVHALDYLHRCGVLHLDLKPANVLVGPGARVMLLDFGTAQSTDASGSLTGGTPGFAAPEVVTQQIPSEAADLYGLGALMYELLTGMAPFAGESDLPLLARQLEGPARSVTLLNPVVPLAVSDLVAALLHPDPARRPNGTGAVRQHLADAGFDPGDAMVGDPPLIGRDEDADNLRELLATQGHVAVVGPAGIGRHRVCRTVLQTLGHQREVVDLSASEDWPERVEVLARPCLVLLGERDPVQLRSRAALLDRCVDHGVQLLASVTSAPPFMRTFYLGPLGPEPMLSVAAFLGLPRSAATRASVRSAAGMPGVLLSGARLEEVQLGADGAELLGLVGLFPGGVPAAALARLVRATPLLPMLRSRGVVRIRDGWVFTDAARDPAFLDPQRRAALREVAAAADIREAYPLWAALAFQLLDVVDEAAALLQPVLAQDRAPSGDLIDHLAWLSAHGVPGAGVARARLLQSDGRPDEALETAQASPESPEQAYQVLRALFELGRPDQALDQAAEAAERYDEPGLWCGLAAYRLRAGDHEGAAVALGRAEARNEAGDASARILGVRLSLEVAALRPGERVDPALLAAAAELPEDLDASPVTLSRLGRTAMRCGDLEVGRRFLGAAARAVRERGFDSEISYTMLNLGNLELRAQRGDEARALLLEGLQASRAAGIRPTEMRCLFSLTELEVRCGRLTQARARLAQFGALIGPGAEEQDRCALLEAALANRSGEPGRALAALGRISAGAEGDVAQARGLLTAEAMLASGHERRAAEALADVTEPAGGRSARLYHLLQGRLFMARAAGHLDRAAEGLDELAADMDADLVGQILMAQASHDVAPETVDLRRAKLDRAAMLLQGPARSRAADLRDRLAGGPSSRLGEVVALMEAVGSPIDFPGVLAQVVARALGAHRVLIMVRIPGLGRRVTFRELTDAEAAGLSVEVMRRIRSAGDVWLEADAVGDPHLRSMSETVRTLSIHSVLAVAIPMGDGVGGALYVDDIHRRGCFTEEHAALLKRLAAATARLLPLMAPSATVRSVRPLTRLGVVLSDPTSIAEFDQVVSGLKTNPHVNLLLTGATGTGKTWLARRIATEVLGMRGLVEATMRRTEVSRLVGLLGGTRRGDFTGAIQKEGLIQRALKERKALFLDEIQALSDDEQMALLPLLELPHRRFGGLASAAAALGAGLTVILCTNADPHAWRSHFREDFWFRLGAHHIHLPELGARGAAAVLFQLSLLLDMHGLPRIERVLSEDARAAVAEQAWPGNLRQLNDAAEKIVQHWRPNQEVLGVETLLALRILNGTSVADPPALPRVAGQRFLDEVLRLLPDHGWNQSAVARELNTTPSRVHRALRRAGLLEHVNLQRATERPGHSASRSLLQGRRGPAGRSER